MLTVQVCQTWTKFRPAFSQLCPAVPRGCPKLSSNESWVVNSSNIQPITKIYLPRTINKWHNTIYHGISISWTNSLPRTFSSILRKWQREDDGQPRKNKVRFLWREGTTEGKCVRFHYNSLGFVCIWPVT
jgi:hypothetical protein